MKSALVLTVAAFVSQLTITSSRPNVTISPRYAHINANDKVTVSCNADQPLVGCEFDRYGYDLIDLSLGPASTPPADNIYYGTGLQNGDCGARMTNFPVQNAKRVDCRVRSATGGWVYRDMKVYVDDGGHKQLHLDSTPEMIVAMPGDNVRVLHRLKAPTTYSLSSCTFEYPTGVHNKLVEQKKTKRYAYFGGGWKKGECGIEIFNVSEQFAKSTGFQLHMGLGTSEPDVGIAWPSVWLLVAKPPESVEFDPFMQDAYTEGDTLSVSCTSRKSRPVAIITWYLGDEVIRSDLDDDTAISEIWSFPNRDQNITQNITRTLRAEDDGKLLTCLVQHMAIPSPGYLNITRLITVRSAPPEPPETMVLEPIEHAPYTEGDTLTLSCKVSKSRPVANITWYLGDEVIRSDSVDDSANSERVRNGDLYIAQNITRTLRAEDDGKALTCQVQHMALPSPGYRNVTMLIAVQSRAIIDCDLLLLVGVGSISLIALCVLIGTIYACVTRRCCFKRRGTEVSMRYRDTIDEDLYDDIANMGKGTDTAGTAEEVEYDDVMNMKKSTSRK